MRRELTPIFALAAALVIGVLVLAIEDWRDFFNTHSGAVQAVTLVILALFTLVYAYYTRSLAMSSNESLKEATRQLDLANKQVEASEKLAEINRNQLLQSAAPLVSLREKSRSASEVSIGYQNIGRGPGLNFRCWIHDPENLQLRSSNKAIVISVLPHGGQEAERTIETEVPGLKHEAIVAQYEDYLGHTYESRLELLDDGPPDMKWGLAKEKIVL